MLYAMLNSILPNVLKMNKHHVNQIYTLRIIHERESQRRRREKKKVNEKEEIPDRNLK